MLNKTKHRQVMFEIIQDIYKSPIGGFLGFKGGTLLYFFENLDRFSVDLDFDLLDINKQDEVENILHDIIQPYGDITVQRNKRQTILFLLNYAKNTHSLKVEISKRISKSSSYEWRSFYGVDVQSMKLEDSLSHKMVATTERKGIANRDFYDIWFLLKKGVRANGDVISERTGKDLRDYLEFLIKYIEKEFKSSQVTVGLGELLGQSKRDWSKVKLKTELLSKLEFYLDSLDREEG